jgi:hypothetical protein
VKVRKRIGKASGGLITNVQGRAFAGGTDPSIRVNPSGASADSNVVRGMAPKNPADNEQGLARGGKIKSVSGKPVGKDDGMIPAKRGEYVVKKSSTAKYGPAKMAAVNKGTAKVTAKGKK